MRTDAPTECSCGEQDCDTWLFHALEQASRDLEELPEWARPIVRWGNSDG